jgi:hypothetical protein
MNGMMRTELLERCFQYMIGLQKHKMYTQQRNAFNRRLLKQLDRGEDPIESVKQWNADRHAPGEIDDAVALRALKDYFGM